METKDFDVIVIGGGIAGASCAAALGPTHRVAILEAEDVAGYHSTGRSAAVWLGSYGPADVRMLSKLSRPFFEGPPQGFTEFPLATKGKMILLATEAQMDSLTKALGDGIGLEPISLAEVKQRVPALRLDYAVGAAIENDTLDLDVAALHQGFLRQSRSHGGSVALRHRSGQINRENGMWQVATSTGTFFRAPYIVNAGGAWADDIARAAGVAPIGLTPCRRTASIIDPAPWDVRDWPLIGDIEHTWYARPEAGRHLLVSPADQTPTHAHDVQPEELDVAIAIDRMQQALDISVRTINKSWAGLRTFTPDGSLAIGRSNTEPSFLWCAGQGGYGIQTAPAAGRLVADLICDKDPGEIAGFLEMIAPSRFGNVAA